MTRCTWADTNELFIPYHDKEWGVPQHDDRMLFEMLNLEGAQAGLSWLTVLKKRDQYRKVFHDFIAADIVTFDQEALASILLNPGIIRNRLKIAAVVKNAHAFLALQKEFGSFDSYIWHFLEGKHLTHHDRIEAIEISVLMSKELKIKGFTFVGATICYAYMQAIGMINDHEDYCFRFNEIEAIS